MKQEGEGTQMGREASGRKATSYPFFLLCPQSCIWPALPLGLPDSLKAWPVASACVLRLPVLAPPVPSRALAQARAPQPGSTPRSSFGECLKDLAFPLFRRGERFPEK